MATMNVSLPDGMKDWVEDHIRDGGFANTSDYVRHLIRKEQQRSEAIAVVQRAIDEGLASGEPQVFSASDFKARMRAS